ncbi:MAG: hypothetical protein IJ868_01105, partial [Prevotella sp.]|nr:hypothetical protein [Prevotella sp.]
QIIPIPHKGLSERQPNIIRTTANRYQNDRKMPALPVKQTLQMEGSGSPQENEEGRSDGCKK